MGCQTSIPKDRRPRGPPEDNPEHVERNVELTSSGNVEDGEKRRW